MGMGEQVAAVTHWCSVLLGTLGNMGAGLGETCHWRDRESGVTFHCARSFHSVVP